MSIVIRESHDTNARPDGYLDALAKLVPGEVIAGYTAALQLRGVETVLQQWIIAAVFTALTPTLLYLAARRNPTQPEPFQYIMRTMAFVLVAMGSNETLLSSMRDLQWIPGVGVLVVSALAAYIATPTAK
jgi:hypothetical protein